MRWTIEGFSQRRLFDLGLDAIDAVIMRFVADFYLSGKMQRIKAASDGREFFWLSYSHSVKELPILRFEARQFSNRIDKLVAAGVLEKELLREGSGTKAYVRFVEETYTALVSDEDFVMKEKELVPATELIEKADRKEGKEIFFYLYNMKALEFRGEKINPLWGAKEASLLKADTTQLGLGELHRCMKLFFSDSVQEVKEFTCTKNKAGYSYSVFHGMLQKLSISPERPPLEPCQVCGGWKHKPGCAALIALREHKQEVEEKELAVTKEAVAGVDFSKLFDLKTGRKHIQEDTNVGNN